MVDKLVLAGQEFDSRLIVGTGKYASAQALMDSIKASGAQIATMAMKRVDTMHQTDDIVTPLRELGVTFMPNTSVLVTPRKRSLPLIYRVRP